MLWPFESLNLEGDVRYWVAPAHLFPDEECPLTSKTCGDILECYEWDKIKQLGGLTVTISTARTVFGYSQWTLENSYLHSESIISHRFPVCKFSSLAPNFH